MSIYIASFDIGKKNFAFVVEKIEPDKIKKIKATNQTEIIEKLNEISTIVLCKNIDITKNCKKKCYFDPKLFLNMTDCLDEYVKYWNKCSVIIIEQQMSFGRKRNTMALKLGQHCFSYFSFNYRDFKKIIEFPAYHKTQVLQAPKKFGKIKKIQKNGKERMIQDNRKKWSIRTAYRYINCRDDKETIQIFEDSKKKDDISDCILMNLAYTYLNYFTKVNL